MDNHKCNTTAVYVLNRIKNLKPAEHIEFSNGVLQDVNLEINHKGHYWNAADCLLEKIRGSAYEYGYIAHQSSVEFFRHRYVLTSGNRTYVSPDYRDRFFKSGLVYYTKPQCAPTSGG